MTWHRTSSDLTLWFRREPDTRDIRESTALGDPATNPIHQVARGSLRPEFSAPAVEAHPVDAPPIFPFVFIVIACGALMVFVSMGTRQSFGLFLQPISLDLGVGRETFSLAIAWYLKKRCMILLNTICVSNNLIWCISAISAWLLIYVRFENLHRMLVQF